jgi:hypothetical protein
MLNLYAWCAFKHPVMNELIYDSVLDFVVSQTGVRRADLSQDTTLLGGLGIDGDDAEQFMQEFAVHFEVDMRGFQFARHFGTEGLPPGFLIAWCVNLVRWWTRNATWEDVVGLKSIALSDLVVAATAHEWPLESSAQPPLSAR